MSARRSSSDLTERWFPPGWMGNCCRAMQSSVEQTHHVVGSHHRFAKWLYGASALQIDSDKKDNNNTPSTRPSGLPYQKYLNQLLEMFNMHHSKNYFWVWNSGWNQT